MNKNKTSSLDFWFKGCKAYSNNRFVRWFTNCFIILFWKMQLSQLFCQKFALYDFYIPDVSDLKSSQIFFYTFQQNNNYHLNRFL